MAKKKVAIITTGGTIAGVSYGPVLDWGPAEGYRLYKAGELSGSELIARFHSLEDIADIEVIDLGRIDSINLNLELIEKYGKAIFDALTREDIAGVVLTHGTDTIEYTSMALSLMLQNLQKPVVITGAIAPPDQRSNHVRTHLEDSIRTAAYSGINEVLVCFSGDEETTFTNLYQGPHISKTRPRKFNAFDSHGAEPIGTVREGQICLRAGYVKPAHTKKVILASGFMEGVVPIMASIMNMDVARGLVLGDYKAMVLEIYGNVGDNEVAYYIASAMLEKGSPVAFAGDCRRSDHQKDIELQKRGAAYLGNMRMNQAAVKMSWAAAQTGKDVLKTQELMYRNVAGEMLPSFYR
jgi:L-asparaginase/Glu-tRNA(Gln) amidotransferase subunit D